MAYGSTRGGAPGTFIYESAIAAQTGRASFNTVYMCVAAPAETSVTVFPFNRPIAINSLNEYENLIGTLPTLGGPELTSYFAVKAFFQNAPNADLRVTRVGTPGVIQELAFSPSGNKDNGVDIPSALQKGDVVYAKLTINGKELGERTQSGAWVGVPVTIPANFVPGDIDNNLAISTAIRDAVVVAIRADADINAGAYIRQVGEGDPACDECAYLYLTGRVFNSQVEIIESATPTANRSCFSLNTYDIQNITDEDESVYDWIQCVRTAFEDPKLPQGYLQAPAAFEIYSQADRVNLGQSMEEIASDSNHKWMAMIDCGPYFVTSVQAYKDFVEHSPADGFEPGEEYLVENVIYLWSDTKPLRFTSANYEVGNTYESANPALADGEKRSLKDDRRTRCNTPVPQYIAGDSTTNLLTLTAKWPKSLASGERIEVATSVMPNDPQPIAPSYNDAYTEVTNEDLVGTFYVVAADVDPTLGDNQIRLATSRARAIGNLPVQVVVSGTPQGGELLDLQYSTPAWEFEVDIKGKQSNLVEVSNNNGSAFNTLHLPASLQKASDEYDFRAVVRQLTDPAKTIIRGGRTLSYFSSAAISGDVVVINRHGLQTGDLCYVSEIPSATLPSGLTSGAAVYAIAIDSNSLSFATSLENAQGGIAIGFVTTGVNSTTVKTPLGASAVGVVTTGGDAVVCLADHGLSTNDVVMFNKDINYTNTSGTFSLLEGTDADSLTQYLVSREDNNFFRVAVSSSNLAAGAFKDFPEPVAPAVTAVTTNVPVQLYRKLTVADNGGQFSDMGLVRFLRGRKYQLDCTLATVLVRDEAGVTIESGTTDPYGNVYATDISTDVRLSGSKTPVGETTHTLAAPSLSQTDFEISGHGYTLGQPLNVEAVAGGVLDSALTEGEIYHVIVVDSNFIQFAETEALAVAGTPISMAGDGSNNSAGVSFGVVLASNPYTFAYTEDEDSYPLNNFRDFAGENNFYCVPLSYGDQANAALQQVYFHVVVEDNEQHTTLFSSYVEIEFVETEAEVPNSLWNFDAVTSADLMSVALRGVNNNGIPQAVVVEKGMDSHNRLFEESQKYFTTQGFLAYFAPYIRNDVGVFIPPTPFVTGLAMRRYRDEVAGFRLPPAGAKYSLAGARGVSVAITSGQQDVSNPYGLNALRQLPGYSSTDPDTGETYGPVFVWGSRTRVNPGNAEQALYKFVNTRVILNVIYGTLRYAFDNQIFNIIDGRAVTFNQIRTIASNTLYEQFYVPGALFGSTAADAFDVIVDDRNNPDGNLEAGVVNVQVFVVPVPTLERIEIDLVRVAIGQIQATETNLGYLPAQNYV